MTEGLADQYLDVIDAIESSVVSFYRNQAHLTDFDVQKTFENLVLYYKDKQVTLKPGIVKDLYERLQPVCDLYLGISDPDDRQGKRTQVPPEPISQEEMVLCLKRLIKSIERWIKSGARRGYLGFIADYA